MTKLEELAKKERNAYQRAWRAKNKERVKAINKRYWENRVKKSIPVETERHSKV